MSHSKNLSFICGLLVLTGTGHAQLTYTTGLDVWLDSRDIDGLGNASLTDGQNISTWKNKGTTGAVDATRVNGSNSAIYSPTSGSGSLGGVTVNNTQFRFTTDFTDSDSYTMYFLVKRGTNSSDASTLLNDYGAGSSLLIARAGAAGAGVRDQDGSQNYVPSGVDVDVDDSLLTLKFIFDASTATATWGLVGNTSSVVVTDYNSTGFVGNRATTLFGFWDGNNGHDYNGTISQVLIYDHVLDSTQQSDVEAYLASMTVIPDADGDGIRDEYELANTEPPSATALVPALDDDGDGLTNEQEYLGQDSNGVEHGFGQTRAIVADTDGDGLNDGPEVVGTDNTDTSHGYGATNPLDTDSDNDGINDGDEVSGVFNTANASESTNPNSDDSDSDGMDDLYEITCNQNGGLDPNTDDAAGNLDGDPGVEGTPTEGLGLTNLDEYLGTTLFVQTRADLLDTDGDGYPDHVEDNYGTWGGDTLTGTDPANPDTDGDGLLDGAENPDLVANNPPSQYKTDPFGFDSDNDGFGDGDEVSAGSDPADNTSIPMVAGIALQLDFHMENASNQEVQGGWAYWDVNKDAQPASINRTFGPMGLTITAGGAGGYITARGGPETDRGGDITGTSWDDVVEDLMLARNGDGTMTLDFTGLAAEQSYTLIAYHNDPYTVSGNPGFAAGDPTVTPSVTTGTLLGSPVAGQITNVRPGVRSDGDFFNSSVSFTTDASGNASIVFTSTNDKVVLSGLNVVDYVAEPEPLAITSAGFNPSDEFEITVTGLDTAKSYVLKRSADLADGFPDTIVGLWTPASETETVVDPAPPEGEAFYRIEEAP